MSRAEAASGGGMRPDPRSGAGEPGGRPGSRGRMRARGPAAARATAEPCLRCGILLALRLMGCRGGHCPNCGHPYPHGDCSD